MKKDPPVFTVPQDFGSKFFVPDFFSVLENLDKAIEFHRTNQNDPHGIGTAVMTALIEVRNAIATPSGGIEKRSP